MKDLQRREFFSALKRHDLEPVGFLGYVKVKTPGGVVQVSWLNAPRQTHRARLAYLLGEQSRLLKDSAS